MDSNFVLTERFLIPIGRCQRAFGHFLRPFKGRNQGRRFVFTFVGVTSTSTTRIKATTAEFSFFLEDVPRQGLLDPVRALMKKRRVHPTTKRKFHHSIDRLLVMTSSVRSDPLRLI